jgi:REP element-mobilizing transposase RayT
MVADYHLIWTAYGWWLPNDPRGSSSHEIRVERIANLGELHHGRKATQPSSVEIRRFYQEARHALQHDLLTFTEEEIGLLADSFAAVIKERGYICYACSLMPDQVHVLIRKHRDKAEEMIAYLQNKSRQTLLEARRRPETHPVWGGPGWKVYLNTSEDMERIVEYIRMNPIKAGRPAQQWAFVKEYDGWMPWKPA